MPGRVVNYLEIIQIKNKQGRAVTGFVRSAQPGSSEVFAGSPVIDAAKRIFFCPAHQGVPFLDAGMHVFKKAYYTDFFRTRIAVATTVRLCQV